MISQFQDIVPAGPLPQKEIPKQKAVSVGSTLLVPSRPLLGRYPSPALFLAVKAKRLAGSMKPLLTTRITSSLIDQTSILFRSCN